jgi:hypothetical protein
MFSFLSSLSSLATFYPITSFWSTLASSKTKDQLLFDSMQDKCIKEIFLTGKQCCARSTSSGLEKLSELRGFVVLLVETESWSKVISDLLALTDNETISEYESSIGLSNFILTFMNKYEIYSQTATQYQRILLAKDDQRKASQDKINSLMELTKKLKKEVGECAEVVDTEIDSLLQQDNSKKIKEICTFVKKNHDKLFAFQQVYIPSLRERGFHVQIMRIEEYYKFYYLLKMPNIDVFIVKERKPTISLISREKVYIRQSNGMKARYVMKEHEKPKNEEVYGYTESSLSEGRKDKSKQECITQYSSTVAGQIVATALKKINTFADEPWNKIIY